MNWPIHSLPSISFPRLLRLPEVFHLLKGDPHVAHPRILAVHADVVEGHGQVETAEAFHGLQDLHDDLQMGSYYSYVPCTYVIWILSYVYR